MIGVHGLPFETIALPPMRSLMHLARPLSVRKTVELIEDSHVRLSEVLKGLCAQADQAHIITDGLSTEHGEDKMMIGVYIILTGPSLEKSSPGQPSWPNIKVQRRLLRVVPPLKARETGANLAEVVHGLSNECYFTMLSCNKDAHDVVVQQGSRRDCAARSRV
jgi:hypothetical protein